MGGGGNMTKHDKHVGSPEILINNGKIEEYKQVYNNIHYFIIVPPA